MAGRARGWISASARLAAVRAPPLRKPHHTSVTDCCTELFSAPPTGPAPAPAPVALSQGMQSLSCDTNPDWCESNQAIIPMCDMAYLLSAATHTTEANTMHL